MEDLSAYNGQTRYIAFVTQKGGTGKTTLAANLAVAAAEAGERVEMLDLDPQQSLTGWRRDRQPDNIHVRSAENWQNFNLATTAFSTRPTLVILDCPGVNSTQVNLAIKQVNLCLVPARPALIDIRAARPTVRALQTLNRPFAFVLNQCTPSRMTSRTNEGREAVMIIGGLKGALAEPMIGARIDYQDAVQHGYGVTEYAPDGKAADEIRHLWHWVKGRLAKQQSRQVKPSHATQTQVNGGSSFRGSATFGNYPPGKPL